MLARQRLCYLTLESRERSTREAATTILTGEAVNILMVINYYSPHVSGLTIYVERISQELVRRGTVSLYSHPATARTCQSERHWREWRWCACQWLPGLTKG